MKNTLKNIRSWGMLYSDGIVDGDKVVLTTDFSPYAKGTEGVIRIRWERTLNCPSRAIVFNIGKCNELAVCPPPSMKFRKIEDAPTDNKKVA